MITVELTDVEADTFRRLLLFLMDGPDCPISLFNMCRMIIDRIEQAKRVHDA